MGRRKARAFLISLSDREVTPMDHARTFAVVLEPEPEGGFTVRVPSLPEIVTYGKDEREALAMAEDAIRLVLEDCAPSALNP
jgi:antitoxin HicB